MSKYGIPVCVIVGHIGHATSVRAHARTVFLYMLNSPIKKKKKKTMTNITSIPVKTEENLLNITFLTCKQNLQPVGISVQCNTNVCECVYACVSLSNLQCLVNEETFRQHIMQTNYLHCELQKSSMPQKNLSTTAHLPCASHTSKRFWLCIHSKRIGCCRCVE